jgi:dolichyl-diphosphooligosaccharide--protein glycosyltransferase
MNRNAEIGQKKIQLDHVREVYTSEHWLVRIYKVKKPHNRGLTPEKARKAAAKHKTKKTTKSTKSTKRN